MYVCNKTLKIMMRLDWRLQTKAFKSGKMKEIWLTPRLYNNGVEQAAQNTGLNRIYFIVFILWFF